MTATTELRPYALLARAEAELRAYAEELELMLDTEQEHNRHRLAGLRSSRAWWRDRARKAEQQLRELREESLSVATTGAVARSGGGRP